MIGDLLIEKISVLRTRLLKYKNGRLSCQSKLLEHKSGDSSRATLRKGNWLLAVNAELHFQTGAYSGTSDLCSRKWIVYKVNAVNLRQKGSLYYLWMRTKSCPKKILRRSEWSF